MRRRKVPELVTILTVISVVASLTTTIIQLATPGPKIRQEGPRLADKQVTTSSLGEPIPVCAGRIRIGTNLIWSTGLVERESVRTQDVGKGGGGTLTTTTYSYFTSSAFAIAGNEADSLCRVWADSKLIYDNSATNTSGTIFKYPEASLELHRGSETQLPDPLIQQEEGIANTPAYRGLCYVVFGDLPLADFGNRIPQITVEVVFDSDALSSQTTIASHADLEDDALDCHDKVVMNRSTRQLIFVGQRPARGIQIARINTTNQIMEAVSEFGGPELNNYPNTDFVPGSSAGERGIFAEHLFYTGRNRIYFMGLAPKTPSGSTLHVVEVNPISLEVLRFTGDVTSSITGSLFSDKTTVNRSGATAASRQAGEKGETGLFFADDASHAHAHLVNFNSVGQPTTKQGSVTRVNPLVYAHGGMQRSTSATTTIVTASVWGDRSFWTCGYHDAGFDNSNSRHASLWRIGTAPPSYVDKEAGVPATFLSTGHFDLAAELIGPNNLRCDIHEPTGMIYLEDLNQLVIFGDTDAGGKQTWVLFDIDTEALVEVVVIPVGSAAHQFVTGSGCQSSLQQGPAHGEFYMAQKLDIGGFTNIKTGSLLLAMSLSIDAAVTQATLDDGTYMDTNSRVRLASDLLSGADATLEADMSTFISSPEERSIYQWSVDLSGTPVERLSINRCVSDPVTLEVIVDRVMDRGVLVKGTDYTLDAAFAVQTVEGFRLTRQMTLRDGITPLAFAYLFDVVESDFVLKFLTRSSNVLVTTIQEDDLGVAIGGGGRSRSSADTLVEQRTQEIELPERVDVTFLDKDRDHQQGNQYAKRQQFPNETTRTRSNANIEVPISMSTDQAKKTAEVQLFNTWLARDQRNWTVGTKHILLDGIDLVNLVVDGVTFQTRITTIDVGEGFALQMQGVRDAIETYTSTPRATFTPVAQSLDAGGATELLMIDTPYLRDQDNTGPFGTGVYMAMGAYLTTWIGALVQGSPDGRTWVNQGFARTSVSWGFIKNVVKAVDDPVNGEFDCRVQGWDRSASIDVFVVAGIAGLSSKTDLQVYQGQNALAIGHGQTAEVLQFKTVTVIDSNTVRLSELIRGIRGMENRAANDHEAGDSWFLLDPALVFRASGGFGGLGVIGASYFFRAISVGQVAPSVDVREVEFFGSELKPLSPCHGRADKLPGSARTGDLVITWTRRTRFGGEVDWLDGVTDVAVNEGVFPNGGTGDLEKYELVLLRKSDNNIEETSKIVFTESATLTSTERTDAGYSSTEAVTVSIYQHSTSIGRGFSFQIDI